MLRSFNLKMLGWRLVCWWAFSQFSSQSWPVGAVGYLNLHNFPTVTFIRAEVFLCATLATIVTIVFGELWLGTLHKTSTKWANLSSFRGISARGVDNWSFRLLKHQSDWSNYCKFWLHSKISSFQPVSHHLCYPKMLTAIMPARAGSQG